MVYTSLVDVYPLLDIYDAVHLARFLKENQQLWKDYQNNLWYLEESQALGWEYPQSAWADDLNDVEMCAHPVTGLNKTTGQLLNNLACDPLLTRRVKVLDKY